MSADSLRTTAFDLGSVLASVVRGEPASLKAQLGASLFLEDDSAAVISLDAAGQSATALLVRSDDAATKEIIRTAISHIARAKALIREATR